MIPKGFKRPKNATIIAVKPYPELKEIVIWPAGPATSKRPAMPARSPEIPMQKIIVFDGLIPAK